jgi:cytoskeleton protein RodZ
MQASSGGPRSCSFDLRRIGELLREAREGKGLSLTDASEALFLTKSTLGAIESGHWDTLPHPVYVKGYVKSYAFYLDVYKRIEEHLHLPREVRSCEGSTEAFGVPKGKGGPSQEYGWPRRFQGLPLKNLALLCSSLVGLAFGTTASPALRTTSSTGLKDGLMAFLIATISLRRFVLP